MKRRPSPEHQVSHREPAIDEYFMEDESEAGEEIRATLTALMPWGISILAHVGLIVVAFFLVWQTIVRGPLPPVVPTLSMSPEFKARVNECVSLESFNYNTGGRGSAHVESAITQALSYKPQLVILLSDNLTGGGQGATQHELMQDDLLKLIHKHNKANPPAKINTIQFLYEDPLVRQGLQGTLDRIAEETGGESRFMSQRDLNLR